MGPDHNEQEPIPIPWTPFNYALRIDSPQLPQKAARSPLPPFISHGRERTYQIRGQVPLRSTEIDIQRFKEIDLNDISDKEIGHAAQIVSTIYNKLGGNNKVAKGSSLLEKVQEVVAQ